MLVHGYGMVPLCLALEWGDDMTSSGNMSELRAIVMATQGIVTSIALAIVP